MDDRLEPMAGFFDVRAEGYDAHMLGEVEGCREGYSAMARLVPSACGRLLDLGCGTGLELEEIFRRVPEAAVTGIDLAPQMLRKLRQKYPGQRLTLLCQDYFQTDLGRDAYDCAVSFQTMHHYSHAAKLSLYRKVCRALRPGGIYLECDYMVEKQADEDFGFAENARLRREQRIPADARYHYDTPCTVNNQIRLLTAAGFSPVEMRFRKGNTTLLLAQKAG